MGMPDGWVVVSYLEEGWRKGRCTILRTFSDWGYAWIDTGVGVLNGGFPDAVSCAVACELATVGCADGHA